MEANQYDVKSMDIDIDFRDIVRIIWKKKVVIVCVTLITAILSGLISLFVISPVYHAQMNVVLNMPELYHTEYGDYKMPITTNQEYIKLITSNNVLLNTLIDLNYLDEMSVETLRSNISINIDNTNSKQNIYNVRVASNNPEEAKRITEILFKNYTEFLNVSTAEGALEFFYNQFDVNLKTLESSLSYAKEILKKNEELLSETSPTINQKAALNELQTNDKVRDFVVLDSIMNPNYTRIEADIITNKQNINDLEKQITIAKEQISEFEVIRGMIKNYHATGDFMDVTTGIGNVADISVYLPSKPVTPSEKSSPSTLMNVLIGAFAGGFLTVSYVLYRWWLNGYVTRNKVKVK